MNRKKLKDLKKLIITVKSASVIAENSGIRNYDYVNVHKKRNEVIDKLSKKYFKKNYENL